MIAQRSARRWVSLTSSLILLGACSAGGDRVTVDAKAPTDGVVVIEAPERSDIGASTNRFVAFTLPALGRDLGGTIFDAEGTPLQSTTKSPFKAPLLGRTIQDDGSDTVQVTGLECYDASTPGGDWECGRRRAVVARLDLKANTWSDYATLDSPLVELGEAFARVEPLGFSGLLRLTGAETEGIWQRSPDNPAKWVLLATDPRVSRSQWCVTNGRIYRGPTTAFRVGDSYGRVESAPIPQPTNTPPQLQWHSNGPISNLPPDNPNGNGISEAETFYLGCRSDGVYAFATGVTRADPSDLRIETTKVETDNDQWTSLSYASAPTGNASMLIDMRQGDGTIALRIMNWSAPAGEGTLSTVYRIDSKGLATQLGPHTGPNLIDSGARDIVISARTGGKFVLVERRSR